MGGASAIGALQTADALNKKRPGIQVINAAQRQIISTHGITGYIRLRMIYLSLLKLVLSRPFLIIIIGVITGSIVFSLFFGWINVYYSLYFFKAEIAVICNVFLTIGNAVYFAFHSFTQMLTTGFADIINSILDVVLTPFVNAINKLAVWTTLVESNSLLIDLPVIGDGVNVSAQPEYGLSYVIPSSAVSSTFGFIFVHPGSPIYETDSEGQIIYDLEFDQKGAELLFPRINEDAVALGVWSEINDRPPDIPYSYSYSLMSYSTTFYDTIQSWVSGWIDDALDIFEESTEHVEPIPPIISPIFWDVAGWVGGFLGGE